MTEPSLSFIQTADGSKTLYNPSVGENYHSINGALQESLHVFVKGGLEYFTQNTLNKNISILEVGCGTGLNFLLSADYAEHHQNNLQYTGIEAYPLPPEIIEKTGYQEYLENKNVWESFIHKYEDTFQTKSDITSACSLRIHSTPVLEFETEELFDIIYFDAFARNYQPEMWSLETITHACKFLKDKGIFVTYSVTGELKRALRSLGFDIQRPAGAAGKREMMRALLNKNNAL
jgi:tRNA U34 5-methylaminomethyl-2-thiouridine-forming methyltransferase MnmC